MRAPALVSSAAESLPVCGVITSYWVLWLINQAHDIKAVLERVGGLNACH